MRQLFVSWTMIKLFSYKILVTLFVQPDKDTMRKFCHQLYKRLLRETKKRYFNNNSSYEVHTQLSC